MHFFKCSFKCFFALVPAVLLTALPAFAQFSDSGQINNEYDMGDGSIVAWAGGVVGSAVGYQDYQDPSLGYASYGTVNNVLGSSADIFSLGDGGSITLLLEMVLSDGPGDDFIVFENGFEYNGVFMELGFVEVSSDGSTFARLPALCRRTTQPGPWDTSDPADFYNLAGNFLGGTGFDLSDLVLAGHHDVLSGAVNLDAITTLRIVDVVGDITGPGGSVDWLGRPVADPYPTPSPSCGMDLKAVGVINTTGEVASQAASWDQVKSLFR
ncbi:MAG: hypothetical protein KOO60_06880 [Gemmatimonadales bacterium]|nr:hypothetical protein [Gemmatimonadales bacterium]